MVNMLYSQLVTSPYGSGSKGECSGCWVYLRMGFLLYICSTISGFTLFSWLEKKHKEIILGVMNLKTIWECLCVPVIPWCLWWAAGLEFLWESCCLQLPELQPSISWPHSAFWYRGGRNASFHTQWCSSNLRGKVHYLLATVPRKMPL